MAYGKLRLPTLLEPLLPTLLSAERTIRVTTVLLLPTILSEKAIRVPGVHRYVLEIDGAGNVLWEHGLSILWVGYVFS